jgi:hypothetical protein
LGIPPALRIGLLFIDCFFHIAVFREEGQKACLCCGQQDRRPGSPDGRRQAWLGFYTIITKEYMENLKTESIKIRVNDGMEEYVAEEKDHGDLVVYDISREGHYLLTMARDGSILFMNFDADEKDREIFKLSHLNTFIEKIKTLS